MLRFWTLVRRFLFQELVTPMLAHMGNQVKKEVLNTFAGVLSVHRSILSVLLEWVIDKSSKRFLCRGLDLPARGFVTNSQTAQYIAFFVALLSIFWVVRQRDTSPRSDTHVASSYHLLCVLPNFESISRRKYKNVWLRQKPRLVMPARLRPARTPESPAFGVRLLAYTWRDTHEGRPGVVGSVLTRDYTLA